MCTSTAITNYNYSNFHSDMFYLMYITNELLDTIVYCCCVNIVPIQLIHFSRDTQVQDNHLPVKRLRKETSL